MARKYWFYSDPHFNHQNIINYCKRPFSSVDEMNEKLIKRYNSLVKPNDVVYYLGDVFMYTKPEEMSKIIKRLNGKKILIKGNHDASPAKMIKAGFDMVLYEAKIKIGKHTVLLSHYPYRHNKGIVNRIRVMMGKTPKKDKFYFRRPINHGEILLHGHNHSKEKVCVIKMGPIKRFLRSLGFKIFSDKYMIHVGVDAWNYYPVEQSTIANMIQEIKKLK